MSDANMLTLEDKKMAMKKLLPRISELRRSL